MSSGSATGPPALAQTRSPQPSRRRLAPTQLLDVSRPARSEPYTAGTGGYDSAEGSDRGQADGRYSPFLPRRDAGEILKSGDEPSPRNSTSSTGHASCRHEPAEIRIPWFPKPMDRARAGAGNTHEPHTVQPSTAVKSATQGRALAFSGHKAHTRKLARCLSIGVSVNRDAHRWLDRIVSTS